ncbi:GNAT family N-acetyltransferase [Deinococcus multiflagellatus]|uniref:GNAT family N-acetyltransferase n=1 Tax=Deinococcus multiflagellatus TaxID=1656887 RepID=UPI001CCAC7AB|nr:GNAT family N-acetyltransferase [Deinococcus multiflagellatus]MBZ9713216.1 GNAT family N-acetyltransferase [Deinococcus multiflagellatus]
MDGIRMTWTAHLTARAGVTPELEQDLRALLQAAYPQWAAFWAGTSFWGSEPEWHLWLAGPDGRPAAQLGCGRRVAEVGGQALTLMGVGGVATHPAVQGQGLGRQLLGELAAFLRAQALADFAFLQCREEVAPFYERSGLSRVPNPAHFLDPDEGEWVTNAGPTLILPVRRALGDWPPGTVGLRGLPW